MLSFSFSYHISWDTSQCVWKQGYEYGCSFFSSVLSPARKSQGSSRLLLQLLNDSGLSGHVNLGEPRQEQQKKKKKGNFPSGYSKDLPCFTKIYYRNALKPSNWILKSMGVQSVDIKKVPWVVSNFKTLSFLVTSFLPVHLLAKFCKLC